MKNHIKNSSSINSRKNISMLFLLILSVLPFILARVAFTYFPDTIPTHYDFAGNVDTFGSKNSLYVLAAVFSISGLVMLLISKLVKKIHEKDEESTVKAENNAYIVTKIGICMMLLFIVMQCCELLNVYCYVNNKGDIPDLKITNIVLMVLLMYSGNIITKVKKNSVIGIRTPWSFTSEEAWIWLP